MITSCSDQACPFSPFVLVPVWTGDPDRIALVLGLPPSDDVSFFFMRPVFPFDAPAL